MLLQLLHFLRLQRPHRLVLPTSEGPTTSSFTNVRACTLSHQLCNPVPHPFSFADFWMMDSSLSVLDMKFNSYVQSISDLVRAPIMESHYALRDFLASSKSRVSKHDKIEGSDILRVCLKHTRLHTEMEPLITPLFPFCAKYCC